jgi:hypothetical protein
MGVYPPIMMDAVLTCSISTCPKLGHHFRTKLLPVKAVTTVIGTTMMMKCCLDITLWRHFNSQLQISAFETIITTFLTRRNFTFNGIQRAFCTCHAVKQYGVRCSSG